MFRGEDDLFLEAPSAQDKELFFYWRNDYRVWKWCRQNGPLDRETHNSYWFKIPTDKTSKMFSVVFLDQTVGCAGLTSIDHVNSRAEFSLYIAPEHQGKGYGKIALHTLVNYGFKYLNLNRIWGEVFNGNPALEMFLDLGFVEEGIRRDFYFRDGKYIDATGNYA